MILGMYQIPPYKFIPPYRFINFPWKIPPTGLLHPTGLLIFHEKSHLHDSFTLQGYLAH